MATSIREILIRVVSEGDGQLKKIANSLNDMNKSVGAVSDSFSKLKSIAYGAAGATVFGFGVREVTGLVDSMILLESRLNSLTGSSEKTQAIMGQLNAIAKETKLSVTDTAESFTRIATATMNLNLPTQVQLDLTKGLIQSFRLAGATAAEAAGATVQFGQALSFGKLSGQELRSVTSQNAIVAGILQKAIEGSGLSMKEFAEKGKFTTAFLVNTLLPAFKELDAKAGKMGVTFGQTLVLATTELTNAAANLNKEWDLNGKFFNALQWILANGDKVQAILIGLAATTIPRLITAILSLNTALLANPIFLWGAAIGAAVGGLVYFAGGIDNVLKDLEIFYNLMKLGATAILTWPGAFAKTKDMEKFDSNLDSIILKLDKLTSAPKAQIDITKPFVPINLNPFDLGKDIFAKPTETKKTFEMIEKVVRDFKEELGALNISFNQGKLSATEFGDKLLSITTDQMREEIKKGELSIRVFEERIIKLKIENLTRQLEYGEVALSQFQEAMRNLKIEELELKFQKGKISAGEFYDSMAKLSPGLQNIDVGIKAGLLKTIDGLGTAASEMSNVMTNAGKSLEDNFFNIITKHQYDFQSFVDSILNDLTRMVIRLSIIAPIAQGFLSMMGLGGGGSGTGGGGVGFAATPIAQANGGAWDNGVQMFANGGIVNSATMFGHSKGLGVMGEAGPEAILPLQRSNGKLGVGAAPVTVNIINNANSEVSTTETTNADGSRMIEVMIVGKVKEGLAKGTFDQPLKQAFGLSRRGI